MNDSYSPANSPAKVSNEVLCLIQKSFDEPLTADEVRTLQDALAPNEAARQEFLQAVQLHIDLGQHGEAVRVCREAFAEFPKGEHADFYPAGARSPEAEMSPTLKFPANSISKVNYYAAVILISAMCLGCGLGIVAAAVMYRLPDFKSVAWNSDLSDEIIVRIVSTHGTVWQESESPETLPTRSLKSGQQIRLQAGLMELAYKTGATVILEGPCIFEVRTPLSGKLYSGKASVTASLDSEGFAIETAGDVIHLAAGQMGVMNSETEGLLVSVLAGEARAGINTVNEDKESSLFLIAADTTARKNSDTGWQIDSAAVSEFMTQLPHPTNETFLENTIHLGNLFDDSIATSLAAAVRSDDYQAAAETIDLGVAAVRDGELDVDFELVDGGVKFNLLNVGGGGPRVLGLPSNDTFRSTHAVPITTRGDFGQITREAIIPKREEGIGICSNEMLTFDLDEIRRAGRLQGLPMRFVADRAGINDLHNLAKVDLSDARMVVIISTEKDVLSAYLNGDPFDVIQRADVFSFDVENSDRSLPIPLRRDGRFVSFDVDVPPHARFLTLATVMLGCEHDDHGVFSGARLEIDRNPQRSDLN